MEIMTELIVGILWGVGVGFGFRLGEYFFTKITGKEGWFH
jgi:F0F1-type ATP synthase assembly protein I